MRSEHHGGFHHGDTEILLPLPEPLYGLTVYFPGSIFYWTVFLGQTVSFCVSSCRYFDGYFGGSFYAYILCFYPNYAYFDRYFSILLLLVYLIVFPVHKLVWCGGERLWKNAMMEKLLISWGLAKDNGHKKKKCISWWNYYTLIYYTKNPILQNLPAVMPLIHWWYIFHPFKP